MASAQLSFDVSIDYVFVALTWLGRFFLLFLLFRNVRLGCSLGPCGYVVLFLLPSLLLYWLLPLPLLLRLSALVR